MSVDARAPPGSQEAGKYNQSAWRSYLFSLANNANELWQSTGCNISDTKEDTFSLVASSWFSHILLYLSRFLRHYRQSWTVRPLESGLGYGRGANIEHTVVFAKQSPRTKVKK